MSGATLQPNRHHWRWPASAVAGAVLGGVWFLSLLGISGSGVIPVETISGWHRIAYTAPLPPLLRNAWLELQGDLVGDDAMDRLLEDDRLLGPSHANSWSVARTGGGRYFRRDGTIIFSTSDNSDPRGNGRTYRFETTLRVPVRVAWIVTLAMAAFAGITWWGMRQNFSRQLPDVGKARCRRLLIGALIACLLAFGIRHMIVELPELMRGPPFWLALGALLALLVAAARCLVEWLMLQTDRRFDGGGWTNALVSISAMTLTFAVLEGGLRLVDVITPSHDDRPTPVPPSDVRPVRAVQGGRAVRVGRAEIVLPPDVVQRADQAQNAASFQDEWLAGPVQYPAATKAMRWHGVLHISDDHGMRRENGPFPARKAGVFRIVVAGDSFTYGFGVDAAWAYPALLEKFLRQIVDVEVINLGVPGAQSEDIARTLARFLPELAPDLVVYGMCQNDFLPSGEIEQRYSFWSPIPRWIRQAAYAHTLLGRMIDDAQRNILIRTGVSTDIWDEVLGRLDRYQSRFSDDLNEMQSIISELGLPPMIGIVLDNLPEQGARGQTLSRTAEALMRSAGLAVIPTDEYYRNYDRVQLFVSRWELHPNEEAHAIFALMIANSLLSQPPFLLGSRGYGTQ